MLEVQWRGSIVEVISASSRDYHQSGTSCAIAAGSCCSFFAHVHSRVRWECSCLRTLSNVRVCDYPYCNVCCMCVCVCVTALAEAPRTAWWAQWAWRSRTSGTHWSAGGAHWARTRTTAEARGRTSSATSCRVCSGNSTSCSRNSRARPRQMDGR